MFGPNGTFRFVPKTELKELEETFRSKVLVMLQREQKIGVELIEKLVGWRHTGFSVHAPATASPEKNGTVGKRLPLCTPAMFLSQAKAVTFPDSHPC
jgi:hypothetical protein